MSLLKVESQVSLYVSQYMYDTSYCRDVIMIIWSMRWIMKVWCL